MKTYKEMTPEERQQAMDQHTMLVGHQRAVKHREACLDAIQAYLKETKRNRVAPTMLYQYPGFILGEFQRLVADLEKAQDAEDMAGDLLYKRTRA